MARHSKWFVATLQCVSCRKIRKSPITTLSLRFQIQAYFAINKSKCKRNNYTWIQLGSRTKRIPLYEKLYAAKNVSRFTRRDATPTNNSWSIWTNTIWIEENSYAHYSRFEGLPHRSTIQSSTEHYSDIAFATEDQSSSFVQENKNNAERMLSFSSSATFSALASSRNSTLEVRCQTLRPTVLFVTVNRFYVPLILSGNSFKGIWTVEITSSASKFWLSLGILKSIWGVRKEFQSYSNRNQASWFRTRSTANGKERVVYIGNDFSDIARFFFQLAKGTIFRRFIFLEKSYSTHISKSQIATSRKFDTVTINRSAIYLFYENHFFFTVRIAAYR